MRRAWRYVLDLWQPWWVSLIEWSVILVVIPSFVASQSRTMELAFTAVGFVTVTTSMVVWTRWHGPFTFNREHRP